MHPSTVEAAEADSDSSDSFLEAVAREGTGTRGELGRALALSLGNRLAAGQVVGQRYRLEQMIGAGGMGVIWSAVHTVTRRQVALKCLKGSAHLDEDFRRRFMREARATTAVRHPNVVEILDWFELDAAVPVIVMELLRGETLAERLTRGRLGPAETASVLIPVLFRSERDEGWDARGFARNDHLCRHSLYSSPTQFAPRRMISSPASSSVRSQGKARPNRRRKPTPEPEPVVARPAARVRFALFRAQASALFARLRKPFLVIWRIALVGAVTASAVASGRLIERYARSSAAFATSEIAVDGLQRLTRDEVLSTAGLALGKNVFEVSPEQAREALQKHPWIAEATVTRRLPGTYRIELREQQAAALLALETLYLVGEDGSVFKPLTAADPVDLPVITGVDAERFRADLGFRSALLTNAVALLHDYRDAGLFRREPISEIHADADGSVSVYVGADSVQVRLGVGPFRKKLRNLRNIFDELKDDAARPAYVYLDNERRPDRVAVRLR